MRTSAAGFVLLLVLIVTGWGPLQRLDRAVARGLNGYYAHHAGQVSFWKAVSAVGQPLTFELLAVAGAAALWLRRRRSAAMFAVAGVLGANLLSTVIKLIVDRTRPQLATVLTHPSGSSFPSGHAITSFAAALVLAVLVTRSVAWGGAAVVAVVVALLVAYSRLALGAHFPTDVAGAWLLAAAWVLALRTRL